MQCRGNCLMYNKSVSATSVKISIVIMTLVVIVVNGESFFPSANAQGRMCENLDSSIALPVLLIHGWNEGSEGALPIHFGVWERQLDQLNIPFCTVSFQQSNDACGSAADHARELGQIIQNVKSASGQNQVNIVGYSKGGLDARVYLANSNSQDVANLIMIGTPNAGSPVATTNNICWPAIVDIRPGAPATMAARNQHTNYYTIAGDWNPFKFCSFYNVAVGTFNLLFSPLLYSPLNFPNDGLVPIESVELEPLFELEPYFTNLRHTSHCHQDLLSDEEYQLALPILREVP
jgi:pimeloyl-ACP methyl ester carboxylesterase